MGRLASVRNIQGFRKHLGDEKIVPLWALDAPARCGQRLVRVGGTEFGIGLLRRSRLPGQCPPSR
jgi:hypothetical protein